MPLNKQLEPELTRLNNKMTPACHWQAGVILKVRIRKLYNYSS